VKGINVMDMQNVKEILRHAKNINYLEKFDFMRINELYELMILVDEEFHPSLSYYKPIHEHMSEYLKEQEAIYLTEKGKMVSVVVFYLSDNKDLHVDGIITHPDYRNKGLSQQLYASIEILAAKSCCRRISLTTWSENKSQLHILSKRGFKHEIRGERSKGIHTIFLWKDIVLYNEMTTIPPIYKK